MNYSPADQQCLLAVARKAIAIQLESGKTLHLVPKDYSPPLQEIRSSFVTLLNNKKLRGCVGSLVAREALVADVARHAHAAAFKDPRFPALSANELENIVIELSILSLQVGLYCASEADLVQQLRPGIDGLTLQDNNHHSTFLPSVWEQLPDKLEFVRQLKHKAGLPVGYWSDSLQFYRYTTLSIKESKPI